MQRDRRVTRPPQQYMTSELLIEEVRRNPCLWDDNTKEYKDRDLKKVVWQRVASQFVGGSPKEVIKAWGNLRKALNNCRNNYAKKYGASGSAGVVYKPYRYEKEMAFLDGVTGEDDMEGNLDNDENEPPEQELVGKKLSFNALGSSTPDLIKKESALKVIQINGQNTTKKVTFGSDQNGSILVYNKVRRPATPSDKTPIKKPKCTGQVNVNPKGSFEKHENDLSIMEESSNSDSSQEKSLHSQSTELNNSLKTMTPAARRLLKKQERQQRLDRQRADVVQKLAEEVANAEKQRKVKLPQTSKEKKMVNKGCCVGDRDNRLEELILKELNEEPDPCKLFLQSIADSVKALTPQQYRQFQIKTLQLLSELEKAQVDTHVDMDTQDHSEACGRFALPQDAMVEVKNIFQASPDERVIIIDNIQLYGRDLQRLSGSEWLDDQILNAYMTLIAKRSEADSEAPSVVCMNTFFLPALMKKGYDHVESWGAGSNVSSADLLFVPAHRPGHWTLIVAAIKEKTITFCDSYGGDFMEGINAVRNYLQHKTGNVVWLPQKSKDMPEQSNGYDCGVFVCMYANYVSLGRNISFTENDMPALRLRMVHELGTGRLHALQ